MCSWDCFGSIDSIIILIYKKQSSIHNKSCSGHPLQNVFDLSTVGRPACSVLILLPAEDWDLRNSALTIRRFLHSQEWQFFTFFVPEQADCPKTKIACRSRMFLAGIHAQNWQFKISPRQKHSCPKQQTHLHSLQACLAQTGGRGRKVLRQPRWGEGVMKSKALTPSLPATLWSLLLCLLTISF